jgi:hypothetical protein
VLAIWDSGASFGPNQEAYYTFKSVQPESQDLMLKVQGDSWSTGYLEVRYNAPMQQVWIFSYAPGTGYVNLGSFPAVFANGDRFGARAWSTGLIQVFQNGAMIGTGFTADWPYNAMGGHVGVILDSNTPAHIDDFGGGDIVINTPPHATEIAPVDSSFYVAGDTLQFVGNGNDGQQSPASLGYEWRVDLHHNNHVHPSVFTALGSTASFVPVNHEDGTGVWYEIELRVTDNGALADTARIQIFPEIDLEPGPVAVVPPYPGTTASSQYGFTIYNHGRMPAPISHWRLVAGTQQLAEGDVLVAPLDSTAVQLTLPPALAAGDYTLRVVVDTLASVVETNETNNAHAQPLTVVAGGGTVDVPGVRRPSVLALSSPQPSPSSGPVSFTLDLPGAATVSVAVLDVLGRRIWSAPERAYEAGRWTIGWDGRTSAGAEAPAGIYSARVVVGERVMVRRIARLR